MGGWDGNQESLRRQAEGLLESDVAPAVRSRLLRDVLGADDRDPRMVAARRMLARSPHVLALCNEQDGDGGWGRFHSEDHALKKRISTTEYGVERIMALGLGCRHPVAVAARRYLVRLICDPSLFSDPAERNERWNTGVRLFAASTLARLEPDAPEIRETWELWREIAVRTFRRGEYDAEEEEAAHRDLTGIQGELCYLHLRGRYQVALLGARAKELPVSVSDAYLNWLCTLDGGMGYLDFPILRPPVKATARQVDAWLTSLELISRFPGWQRHAQPAIEWLWSKRDSDGYWDLGSRWSKSPSLPLSDNWRNAAVRRTDWTARIICLLVKV